MKIHSFTAVPTTPPQLAPLLEIASNLWFSWNWDATQLFSRIDPDLWEESHKNPIKILCSVSNKRLEELSKDEDYVAEVQAVHSAYKKYLGSKTWFEDKYGSREKKVIAYFSCEFGIHESLPIYSGGLGVLAGDHLKSASDLGVPLVAVGFLYREGYFRQGLNSDGMQQEFYPENDKFSLPVTLEKDAEGNAIVLSMDIGGDEVFYQIWKAMVGRVTLYLLDTNLNANIAKHRDITKRLYDAGRDIRLRQEILLGMGGVKALTALGITPSVYHINEGHSAFLILERLRDLMESKFLTFAEAREIVWASNVFTTHTPVPAGNERFDIGLIKQYLGAFVHKRLGLEWLEFLAMGREDVTNMDEEFCLTVLALKFSAHCNGVAKLHGVVSRDMWKNLYKDIPQDENPIRHVTNGVHTKSWLSKEYEQLFARYQRTSYVREISDFTMWRSIDDIPEAELWRVHSDRKKVLVDYVRQRVKTQLQKRGASAAEINRVKDVLDPEILTIGFARRFAPYKRGALLFHDTERVAKIVNNESRPVQFIFAGKAHPADTKGKEIIKALADKIKDPEFNQRVVFLEDYDIDIARYMVQGVDVWLNTPRRPMEASGTSGMKAAMNGALNLSVLDGWWDEAFNGENGWAIGHGELYKDLDQQDEIEANLLYRAIEDEVAPLFYERNDKGLPEDWIVMMKNTIESCGSQYNTHRMLVDYIEKYYLKAEKIVGMLTEKDYLAAKNLSHWHKNIEHSWKDIKIVHVDTPATDSILSGSNVAIKAKIHLGVINPEDVKVEVYHGILDINGDKIIDPQRTQMKKIDQETDLTIFEAQIPCDRGGRYGYTVRVLLGNKHLAEEFLPSFIKWESD